MAISQQLTGNVSKELSLWTFLYLFLRQLKSATEWEKIFTWPSMTIAEFLMIIKLMHYESFIDQCMACFSRPLLAFIVPDNVAIFLKSQAKDDKFTHLMCPSHSLNLIALAFLKDISMSILRRKLSMHILISVTRQRIQKLHRSGHEHDYK